MFLTKFNHLDFKILMWISGIVRRKIIRKIK